MTDIYPHLARSSDGAEYPCWGKDIPTAHAWAAEQPSAEQLDWHERAARRGVTVYVVSSAEGALRAVTGAA
jgi:hypothetical protein